MIEFKECAFGDYSGLREYRRNRDRFMRTFVLPESFSMNSLRNDGNFVVVGRKGSGKSTCCLALGHRKQEEGFATTFYSFSDDLNRLDLKEAVQTQVIDLRDLSTRKLFDSILEFYDFRELWKRKVLNAIARRISEDGGRSPFTTFATSVQLSEASIAEGVGKGLNVTLPDIALPGFLKTALSQGPTEKTLSLRKYNDACMRLLRECHPNTRHMFFFDELNLSHTKSDSSEYDTLIALIRDIVRAAAELNDDFAEAGMAVHVICALRPEIRNEIVRRDAELSKIVDSNYVRLSWPHANDPDNPLIEMLRQKLIHGGIAEADLGRVIPDSVQGIGTSGKVDFATYALNISWYRPRDMVRILKCYQTTNGNRTRLFDPGGDQIRFLKEYSRISREDCFAELEVRYSRGLLEEFAKLVKRPVYRDLDAFRNAIAVLANRLDVDAFVQDLFDAGVILNHQRDGNRIDVYASFRDDTTLDPDMRILIHRGLQPEFHLGYQIERD